MNSLLRGDDDMDQFKSASTLIEGIVRDGGGGGGDGHIRTATTGSAAAVHLSNYRHRQEEDYI